VMGDPMPPSPIEPPRGPGSEGAPAITKDRRMAAGSSEAQPDSAAASRLMLDALKRDNADLAEYSEAFLVATADMLAERLPGQPKRARSIAYNLPRNETLRRALLSGTLAPRELCEMEPHELASEAVKRARTEVAARAEARLRAARVDEDELFSSTRSVRCSECGGARARFKHLGTDLKDWVSMTTRTRPRASSHQSSHRLNRQCRSRAAALWPTRRSTDARTRCGVPSTRTTTVPTATSCAQRAVTRGTALRRRCTRTTQRTTSNRRGGRTSWRARSPSPCTSEPD
jgi:hypothetical protein